MVRRRLLVSLALVAFVAAPRLAAQSPAAAAVAADADSAIRAVMQASAEAWNRGDMAGHVAIYADSASFMTGRGLRFGRDSIAAGLARGFWRDGKPTQQLRFEDLVVRPLGGDHALVTGAFILSGGGRPENRGRYTTIWRRTPRGWRMIHDHSS